MKLFVSYARVDIPLCKQIVERLSDVHDVWYDKRLYAGQDWWQEILRRLHWCEGFVYLLSPESVESDYCRDEFEVALNSDKHIFPTLIQAGTPMPEALKRFQYADLSRSLDNSYQLLNAITIAERQRPSSQVAPPIPGAGVDAPAGGSLTLDRDTYRALVSLLTDQMGDTGKRRALVDSAFFGSKLVQRINFSGDAQTFTTLLVSESANYGEIEPGRPALVVLLETLRGQVGHDKQQEIDRLNAVLKGSTPPVQTQPEPQAAPQSNFIGRAADALDNGKFDEAVFILEQALKHDLSQRRKGMVERMLKEAQGELEAQARLKMAQHDYAPIVELVRRERTRHMGCEAFADFREDHPDYDPEGLAALCGAVDGGGGASIEVLTRKTLEVLPEPFAWIEIPAGQVTIEGDTDSYVKQNTTFDVDTFAIAKYPVTNAQFARFIDAGGYDNRGWWTDEGWQVRQEKNWTLPRLWTDDKFNGAEQPVVGVSWYEAMAFCQWLSETTGQNITLPTEQQWQRAAQGDDGRMYPWGDEWDCTRCNSADNSCEHVGRTTPVIQYEGKGNSPFEVVDMAGNVWEWCVTGWREGNFSNSDGNITRRVLRGGSWLNSRSYARAAYRSSSSPSYRDYDFGFRLCCVRAPSL